MASTGGPPLYTRYGFSRTGRPESPLVVEPYAQVCREGALSATVVASAIDLVGGLVTRERAGAEPTFTIDLSLRIPVPGIPSRLETRADPLRVGRRLVTTSVQLVGGGGLYATGVSTFLRLPRQARRGTRPPSRPPT